MKVISVELCEQSQKEQKKHFSEEKYHLSIVLLIFR